MHEFDELPDDDFRKDDERVKLFLPIMNLLASKKLIENNGLWRFLFDNDDYEKVVAYVIWEDGGGPDEQVDIQINDDEIEVVYWRGDFVKYISRLNKETLTEESGFLR